MGMLNEIFASEMTPKMAIIVYEGNGYYLEERDIENGLMGAGSPLTIDKLSEIMSAISVEQGKELLHGSVPENVLYVDPRYGKETVVWYTKPQKRMMYFTKDLGIKDGKMYIPGLVWVVRGQQLAMYAYKGQKPKRGDKLYRAPFFNVSESYVCLGSAKTDPISSYTITEIIGYYERMFWGSEFAHILGDNPVNGNLATITKQCIEEGARFPEEKLKKVNITLNDIMR